MKEILNFYDPSFHRIFEFENFRFSFSTKNSLTCMGSESENKV